LTVEHDALPLMLRHMALAIYEKKGSGAKAFFAAMDISRAKLVEYGYLTPPSEKGPLERIRMTAKGLRKNAEHQRDKARARKVLAFKALYEKHRAAYVGSTDKRTDETEADRKDA
jgi:hypothetical protein